MYAKTDYAANAGSYMGSDSSTTTASSSSTAMDTNYNGISYRKSQVREADIDAMSCTIFAAEKYMNSIHYLSATPSPTTTAPSTASDRKQTAGCRRCRTTSQIQAQPMKDNLAAAQRSADDPSYRFGSNHAPGFHAAFCDGSVNLLPFSIDPAVMAYLGVRSNKSVLSGCADEGDTVAIAGYGRQQIRGICSPESRSTMRLPPSRLRSLTVPGCSAVTRPMAAACGAAGWLRMISSTRSAAAAGTRAIRRPSLAT